MENVNEEIKRIEELLKKPLPAGLKSNMEDRLALLKKKASGEEPATKKAPSKQQEEPSKASVKYKKSSKYKGGYSGIRKGLTFFLDDFKWTDRDGKTKIGVEAVGVMGGKLRQDTFYIEPTEFNQWRKDAGLEPVSKPKAKNKTTPRSLEVKKAESELRKAKASKITSRIDEASRKLDQVYERSEQKTPEKVSDFDIIKRTYYWEAVSKNGESTGIEGKTKAETLKKLKENLSETEKKPSPKKQKPKLKAITLDPNIALYVDQVKTEDGKTLYGGGLRVLGEITVKFFPFMYETDKELIASAKKYLTEIVSVSLIRDRGEKTKDGRYLVFFNDGQEHKQFFTERRMALNFRNAILPIVKKNQKPETKKAPAKKRSELTYKDVVYIDFLNKDKGYNQDREYFESFSEAEKWAKKEFEKYHPDMIRMASPKFKMGETVDITWGEEYGKTGKVENIWWRKPIGENTGFYYYVSGTSKNIGEENISVSGTLKKEAKPKFETPVAKKKPAESKDQEIREFVEYVSGFYGKKGIYAKDYSGGFTQAEIKESALKYVKDPKTKWGGGDSVDREFVRDRYLIPLHEKKKQAKKKSSVAQKKASVKRKPPAPAKKTSSASKKKATVKKCKVGDTWTTTKTVKGKKITTKHTVVKAFRTEDEVTKYLLGMSTSNRSHIRSPHQKASGIFVKVPEYVYEKEYQKGRKLYFEFVQDASCPFIFVAREEVAKKTPPKKRSSVAQKKASVKKTTPAKKTAPKKDDKKSEKIKQIKKRFKKETSGRSDRAISQDLQRKAKKAGKRISEDGNVYYEYRPEKTDTDRRSKI